MSATNIDRDALIRLESELINIKGVVRCLILMSNTPDRDAADAIAYLGGRLFDHHKTAYQAFEELFEAAHGRQEGGAA